MSGFLRRRIIAANTCPSWGVPQYPSGQRTPCQGNYWTKLMAGLFAVFPQSARGGKHRFGPEHRFDLGRSDRAAEEVALGHVAAVAGQERVLGLGFDALGDH